MNVWPSIDNGLLLTAYIVIFEGIQFPYYLKNFSIILDIFNFIMSLSFNVSGCLSFKCLNANLTLFPQSLHFALPNILNYYHYCKSFMTSIAVNIHRLS